MFAVLGRFNRSYEEAAIDLGATNWQKLREVTLPILLPGIIGVALFGFTLSYDEIAAHGAGRRQQEHPAARDLGDDHQRHLAGALCASAPSPRSCRSSSSSWRWARSPSSSAGARPPACVRSKPA